MPTEAEWEYAARGPDGLLYPWGNDRAPENAIYRANSGSQTAIVGKHIRTAGASWVGALDMSGNVWEWVSTIYTGYDYPYVATDGREDLNRTDIFRLVRGGSWNYLTPTLRSSPRFDRFNDVGFRCARSE